MQWFGGRSDETFGVQPRKCCSAADMRRCHRTCRCSPSIFPPPREELFRVDQNFFVVEPEVERARQRSRRNLRLTVGAGYRFTGTVGMDRYYYFDGHTGLNGAVGSIGVQIGGGS